MLILSEALAVVVEASFAGMAALTMRLAKQSRGGDQLHAMKGNIEGGNEWRGIQQSIVVREVTAIYLCVRNGISNILTDFVASYG
jgi:hypothetical protein